MAVNCVVRGQIWSYYELIQALMYVIDTCKYEKDSMKNSGEKVAHRFSQEKSIKGRSGAVDRASDFGPRGPWFDSPPVHISLWP